MKRAPAIAGALLIGHRLEADAPTPFAGAGDVVTRLFAEQWITFPRFVLSGGWYRAFTQSKAR